LFLLRQRIARSGAEQVGQDLLGTAQAITIPRIPTQSANVAANLKLRRAKTEI
jgi:hypothetical protein